MVACGKDILGAKVIQNSIENETKTNIFVVEEKDVKSIQNLLTKSIKTVPETSKAHQVIWNKLNKNKLFFWYASCTECLSKTECTHFSLKHTQTYPLLQCNKNIEIESGNRNNDTLTLTRTLNNNYQVGEWIVVVYEKIWYPGVIIELKDNILVTNFMSKYGKTFSWPKKQMFKMF